MNCNTCGSGLVRTSSYDQFGRWLCGNFNKLLQCKNKHITRLCNVCGRNGSGFCHFNEKYAFAGRHLSIVCRNDAWAKDKLLTCKDVIDVIPHAFCFKRDYGEIAKIIYSDNEPNFYDDGEKVSGSCGESFILVTRYSECFRDVINALSSSAVECSHCEYEFDSFPTLRMFQDHLAADQKI